MLISVARFFCVQHTKTVENIPNDHTIYVPNGSKTDQRAENFPTLSISRPSKIYPKIENLV
jgi:hypothetical protein